MMACRLIAAALLGAAPLHAMAAQIERPGFHITTPVPLLRPEAKVREMADYLEAVADPRRGVYIRGYTGQWYYAQVRGNCPRLTRSASLRFNPSPGGDFDRNSSLRADGWRCMIASVVESAGPPRPHRR